MILLPDIFAIGFIQRRKNIVETLRLLWQDDAHVRCGLPALRARAAACLRIHDDSGFFLAGALLAERCQKQTNGIELRA